MSIHEVRGFLKQWPYSYTNLIAAGTTKIKITPGFLHSIIINNPGSGVTISIYDNISSKGNLIGTITPTVTTTLIYDVAFLIGLTIVITVTTAIPDVTISWN